MTIQNKVSQKRYRVTSDEWDLMKSKNLETGNKNQTYASLYKVIDADDSSPLDEKESSESNVPDVLKTFSKRIEN